MNTKHLFLILICATLLSSCGGNTQEAQGPTFAPKPKTETVVTKRPTSSNVDSVLAFIGQVKLNIMI